MYDALTRHTYAELFKAAEAELTAKIAASLAPVLKKHPHLATAVGTGQ